MRRAAVITVAALIAAWAIGVAAPDGPSGTYASLVDFQVRSGSVAAGEWTPTLRPPTPDECASMAFDQTLVGTDGPDVIDLRPPEQSAKRNLVFGLGGDDVVYGGNQDDCLVGGDGVDWLLGGNGKDVLIGGNGGDTLDGENGTDVLYGQDGDDVLIGSSAPDVLNGGDGTDVCSGGAAPDLIEECEA